MISAVSRKAIPLSRLIYAFSTSTKVDPKRVEEISKATPLFEYTNLNPIEKKHEENQWKIIEDQTKIKFLVEEGGFSNCSDIGILLKMGTQNQNQSNAGSLNCLKNLVHMKRTFEESIQNYEFLHQTGSSFDISYDQQNTFIKSSFFQEDLDVMVDLVLDLALSEKKLYDENFQTELNFETINHLVRDTAFGRKGIGMPVTGLGQVLTNQAFQNFQRTQTTPHGSIISMSNVKDSEALIEKIKNIIKQNSVYKVLKRAQPEKPVSKYVGGIQKLQINDPFFEFAVAVPAVEFRNPKMELYNILRILLGNASSFSSGGPGKGMHSRCTKNLLNSVACIESASYILQHYDSFGLFGITTAGPHGEAHDVVESGIMQLAKLKRRIPEEQLERAKNILIASIYSNVERQSDRLHELTMHLTLYGQIKLNKFQQIIRSVTAQDIQNQMQRIFSLEPTFVLKGDNSSFFQKTSYEQLKQKLLKY